jgi:hypothetical protein
MLGNRNIQPVIYPRVNLLYRFRERLGFNSMSSNIGTVGALRRTYGFNSAEIQDNQWTDYDTVGYSAENLMVSISY